MDEGLIERIENGAVDGASLLLAAAVCYAANSALQAVVVQPQLGICAAGAGALAFLPCSRALRGSRPNAGFVLPGFALADLQFPESGEELLLTERLAPADELVLTEADRLGPPGELLLSEADRLEGPLVLDDILSELGPESRVVRLFDRKAMSPPTPGQLQSRIANHLSGGSTSSAPANGPADASQALSAALAELRRSLR